MRESCSCGAAIHTLWYGRALTWRYTHRCEQLQSDIVSETQIATGFQLEPPPEADDE